MHYQSSKNKQPIGKRAIVHLGNGDLYIISEKAVGNDWKKKKYTNIETCNWLCQIYGYLMITPKKKVFFLDYNQKSESQFIDFYCVSHFELRLIHNQHPILSIHVSYLDFW